MNESPITDDCSLPLLREKVSLGKPLFLLDVRNPTDFENWKIELQGLQICNHPYDDLLADGWKKEALSYLPKDKEILVVCYRGRTSCIVTSHLKELGFNALSLKGGMQAWGNLYECHPILEAQDLEAKDLSIYQISRVGRGCLSYVIASGNQAIVIDPTRHLEPYLELIEKFDLHVKGVIDTHAHADHISGGRTLSEKLNAPYFLHPYDAIHPLDLLPATFDYHPLFADEKITLGDHDLEVLHLPGHTLGNLALLLDKKYLFAGDTIFLDSIARPDLGGKTLEWSGLHFDSIKKILSLPDETLLLPGHIDPSKNIHPMAKKVGLLKETNEGIKKMERGKELFCKNLSITALEIPSPYDEIKRVNLGLKNPSEEEIYKLELGKNLCAL